MVTMMMGKMNKSMAVVCDELHITNLESVLHETVGGISAEQWINFKILDFIEYQSNLNDTCKKRLKIILSEIAEVIS